MAPSLNHLSYTSDNDARPVISCGRTQFKRGNEQGSCALPVFFQRIVFSGPCLADSSVVRRLPGTARRNNARAYFRSGLRPSSTKSVPNSPLGFLINFKRVMARSLVCQDFRNAPFGRRLHAQQHGDNQWLNPGSHTPDKMRFVQEQQRWVR